MKILLIYPYFLEQRIHEEEISVPPTGIYYVGAALKARGFEVEVLNWYACRSGSRLIAETLASERPDVIGFSILHANRWGGIEIAATAKKTLPDVCVVFGGIGASYLWELLLNRFPQIDFVVVGEGERNFTALVTALAEGRRSAIPAIPGIASRRDGRAVLREPAEPLSDLDELADPARYFSFQHVSLTRGCPGGCRFCGSPNFWGRRVRFHSSSYFVDQLERLQQKGNRFFFFSDDTFTLRKRSVLEICRQILQRGLNISWQAISRVDTIDEEMLRWMRRAGCIQISYGVESGSQRIRRRLGKDFSQSRIEEAFHMTTRFGILPRAYFIYGCPGESPETIQETIALVRRIRPLAAIFYILDLFPGTGLYEDFIKRSGLTDDIWLNRMEDILYFETDPALSAEQVLSFGKALRTAFYRDLPGFVRSIDLVDDKELGALHADFLSRLAMTFDHGDYARVAEIPEPAQIAEELYQRALSYHPVPRAFLGLGILRQRAGDYAASIRVLREGARRYPGHEELGICLAVSLMNLGEYAQALQHLLPFQGSQKTAAYIEACRRDMREG
jgi:radical SAM superfamily enzyme YgiQ (UPF0313 family)